MPSSKKLDTEPALDVSGRRLVLRDVDLETFLHPKAIAIIGASEQSAKPNTAMTRKFDAWARQHGVTVIDAAASEHFGCKPEEFLDENHAWPECHARVLGRYWDDHAQQRIAVGLYRPAR